MVIKWDQHPSSIGNACISLNIDFRLKVDLAGLPGDGGDSTKWPNLEILKISKKNSNRTLYLSSQLQPEANAPLA
jgi:hypothetical protein